uniref:endo-polygalacturonase n=1 Tax=Phytophthora capsici TaxID=4784 RepID=T1NXE6_PHYCP|nr:polygalacturonase [Phytophthora capsici]
MKFLSATIVLTLLIGSTHGGRMVRQSTNPKCNAKNKISSSSAGSSGSNTQQWSSAASQTGQTEWTQTPSTGSSTQQWSSTSSGEGSSTSTLSTDSSQSTQQQSSTTSSTASSQTQQSYSDSSQSTQQQSSTASSGASTTSSACTLTGTYSKGADVSTCKSIIIKDLSVAKGATITFEGTTTFEQAEWEGPLILLTGTDLTVAGTGTLDGQGDLYWKKGTSITRPVFFRLKRVMSSTVKGFNIKNSPYRTFSILDSEDTTVSGLTLDSKAGDNVAKNTDGFDLSRNLRLTISGCTVYNQDDCLAMQSSNDTTFTGNTCSGGHGISIGSLGGDSVTESDIVSGLTVKNNKIIDSVNGIRIKTIAGKQGTITGASYTDNTLSNVKNAIVIHSDYSKEKGGYTGDASSLVEITDVTVSGLSGTAKNVYDVLVNPKVVSGWTFSGITVKGSAGSCSGEPSGVKC